MYAYYLNQLVLDSVIHDGALVSPPLHNPFVTDPAYTCSSSRSFLPTYSFLVLLLHSATSVQPHKRCPSSPLLHYFPLRHGISYHIDYILPLPFRRRYSPPCFSVPSANTHTHAHTSHRTKSYFAPIESSETKFKTCIQQLNILLQINNIVSVLLSLARVLILFQ